MKRVIQVYESEDLDVRYKVEISELFLIIAKNIGLRKIFLNTRLHELLVKSSLGFVDLVGTTPIKKGRINEVYQNAIKLLCLVCTARKTQFYIPGETNLSERLRKRAFDSGTFTLLTYLFNALKDVDFDPFRAIREHIKEHVLNYATMTDLTYHTKLLAYIKANPGLEESPSNLRLNQSSALEERKDSENSPNQTPVDVEENSMPYSTPMTVDRNAVSSKVSNQTSPRAGTSRGTKSKKAQSTLMNYTSQSNAASALAQGEQNGERASGQLYQVDTEKLLLSTDKVTISDLWKQNPQVAFPRFFL